MYSRASGLFAPAFVRTAALFELAVGVGGHFPPLADFGELRREHQREGHDTRVGVARFHELRRLRDVLAEHDAALHGVPEFFVHERFPGGAAVRGVVGIGDGEFFDRAVGVAQERPIPG